MVTKNTEPPNNVKLMHAVEKCEAETAELRQATFITQQVLGDVIDALGEVRKLLMAFRQAFNMQHKNRKN